MSINSPISKIIMIFIGGIVLSFMAFYNNYPFLYPDTGGYIFTGFLSGVPPDRPKTYGLFIRHISLAEITWLVIIAQGTIVSALIYLYIKYLVPKINRIPTHFILIAFLTFFTGVSVVTSFLMPDIFAPIVLLSMGLLLIAPISGKGDWFFICLFLWLGLIVHISHLVIMLGVLSFFTLVSFWKKKYGFERKRLVMCWVIFGISILSIPTIHYIAEKEFVFSKGSHLFIMNHLVEIGVIDSFLEDRCPTTNYTLCDFQGKILTDFLWNKNSPPQIVWKGKDMWKESKEEYNNIIKEIIMTPKYLKIITYKSLTYTAKQFFSFNVGAMSPKRKGSIPYSAISSRYKYETREQELAFQQRRNHFLKYDGLNTRQTFLFFLSLCFYVAVFYVPKLRENLSHSKKQLLFFIMIALLMNAFVCGNLSTVIARYQCRVLWLLPLVLVICLIELVPKIMRSKSNLE